jgi:hypothetical protein
MADFRSRHLIAELLADLIPELLLELDDGIVRQRKTLSLFRPVLPVSGLAFTTDDVIVGAVGGLVILARPVVGTGRLFATNVGTGRLTTTLCSTGWLAGTGTSRPTAADFRRAHCGRDHTDSKIADFGHHSSFSLCRMDGPEALLQE